MSELGNDEKLDVATFEELMNGSMDNIDNGKGKEKNEIVEILKSFFSLDFLTQKSNISMTNAEGLIEIQTYIDYHKNKYFFIDRVAQGYRKDTLEILQSVNGWKTDKVNQAFTPIKQNIDEKEQMKTNKQFRIG